MVLICFFFSFLWFGMRGWGCFCFFGVVGLVFEWGSFFVWNLFILGVFFLGGGVRKFFFFIVGYFII